jgi:hypothetical protein
MRGMNLHSKKFSPANFAKWAAVAILLGAWIPQRSLAQEQGQKTFSSPEDAAKAIVTAARNNDQKAMLDILGPDAKQIVYSGDDAQDAHDRDDFVQKYQVMHRFVKEPDGTTTLYIGAENWPTPIPLLSKAKSWYFDSADAKKEILFRRVGENEMSTIRVSKELVAAQKEYYSAQHQVYAQKIFSDNGQRNGLYWPTSAGQPKSPIGPLIASAVAEGFASARNTEPTPFHGYLYHGLMGQGKDAPGGAKVYMNGGKMTSGFAFIAYPAEYRSSGVMTFIVDQDGVVYQKDLGKGTAALAKALKEYDPDSTWQKAEDMNQQQASAAAPAKK